MDIYKFMGDNDEEEYEISATFDDLINEGGFDPSPTMTPVGHFLETDISFEERMPSFAPTMSGTDHSHTMNIDDTTLPVDNSFDPNIEYLSPFRDPFHNDGDGIGGDSSLSSTGNSNGRESGSDNSTGFMSAHQNFTPQGVIDDASREKGKEKNDAHYMVEGDKNQEEELEWDDELVQMIDEAMRKKHEMEMKENERIERIKYMNKVRDTDVQMYNERVAKFYNEILNKGLFSDPYFMLRANNHIISGDRECPRTFQYMVGTRLRNAIETLYDVTLDTDKVIPKGLFTILDALSKKLNTLLDENLHRFGLYDVTIDIKKEEIQKFYEGTIICRKTGFIDTLIKVAEEMCSLYETIRTGLYDSILETGDFLKKIREMHKLGYKSSKRYYNLALLSEEVPVRANSHGIMEYHTDVFTYDRFLDKRHDFPGTRKIAEFISIIYYHIFVDSIFRILNPDLHFYDNSNFNATVSPPSSSLNARPANVNKPLIIGSKENELRTKHAIELAKAYRMSGIPLPRLLNEDKDMLLSSYTFFGDNIVKHAISSTCNKLVLDYSDEDGNSVFKGMGDIMRVMKEAIGDRIIMDGADETDIIPLSELSPKEVAMPSSGNTIGIERDHRLRMRFDTDVVYVAFKCISLVGIILNWFTERKFKSEINGNDVKMKIQMLVVDELGRERQQQSYNDTQGFDDEIFKFKAYKMAVNYFMTMINDQSRRNKMPVGLEGDNARQFVLKRRLDGITLMIEHFKKNLGVNIYTHTDFDFRVITRGQSIIQEGDVEELFYYKVECALMLATLYIDIDDTCTWRRIAASEISKNAMNLISVYKKYNTKHDTYQINIVGEKNIYYDAMVVHILKMIYDSSMVIFSKRIKDGIIAYRAAKARKDGYAMIAIDKMHFPPYTFKKNPDNGMMFPEKISGDEKNEILHKIYSILTNMWSHPVGLTILYCILVLYRRIGNKMDEDHDTMKETEFFVSKIGSCVTKYNAKDESYHSDIIDIGLYRQLILEKDMVIDEKATLQMLQELFNLFYSMKSVHFNNEVKIANN